MSLPERIISAVSVASLAALLFFLASFGLARLGVLLAISGLFQQPLYWLAFSSLVLTASIVGARIGVTGVVSSASKVMYLIFGGGTCSSCGNPYGKEAVNCAQCGKLVNEPSNQNHT